MCGRRQRAARLARRYPRTLLASSDLTAPWHTLLKWKLVDNHNFVKHAKLEISTKPVD